MYQFLSSEWIEAIRQIRDEYRDRVGAQLGQLVADPLAVNLVITEMPDGAADTLAHSVTAPRGADLDLGHLDEAAITVTLDFETARSVVIEQDLTSVMRAFVFGKLRIDGDIGSLLGDDAERDPEALIAAFNVAGISSLGDVDPLAAEIGERVRAVTT